MTPEEIREIVRLTIKELTQNELIIQDNYQSIVKAVGKKLTDYFEKKNDKRITHILNQLADDFYIDIIYLQYRDKKSMEWIADILEKDVSTIKRNKKRLITKIYKMLEE